MIDKIQTGFTRFRAKRIASFITPFLHQNDKVLDFGCGNLLVAEYIKKKIDVDILGLDVIDIHTNDIPFQKYAGEKIPFPSKRFDVLYASGVLHHINDLQKLLTECLRVVKKRLIILEDTPKNYVERTVAKFLDHSNLLISHEMNLALNFKSESEWYGILQAFPVKKICSFPVRPNPIRLTRHRLFVVDVT